MGVFLLKQRLLNHRINSAPPSLTVAALRSLLCPAPSFSRPVGPATVPFNGHHPKLAALAAIFLVCIHSKSQAAATLFEGATSQSEISMIYRSEVFAESRNFSNYGRVHHTIPRIGVGDDRCG